MPVPEEYLREQIADEADRAWTTPHPLEALAQPVRMRNASALTLPLAYIFCTEGKDESASSVRFAAKYRSAPGWRYQEVAANHMAPITAPRALAEAFLSLV